MAKFYITNAIPYVNAKPHIGHALEFVQSDTIARYHAFILKEKVAFSCGADENALKNVQAAEDQGISVQELVDKNTKLFFELWNKLGAKFDKIVRGSDPKHIVSSQKLWKLCHANNDIYKKTYAGLYCVGCELFYEKEELNEHGECGEHPGKKLEEVSEENYFFKLSNYQNELTAIIQSSSLKITPEIRKNEILSFLKGGLKDISISRSNERAKNWGVPVPNDPTQRMYVWFDALNIYQTAVGFGDEERQQEYEQWWPADLHVIGKGISRFHAIYWPAFLLSAKLKLPKKIFVHEYITVNGQKMSKTIGNVIDPIPLIEKYGTDALRYYLLAKISPFSDGDFTEEKLKETYNADLANGLGNAVSRVAKLAETSDINFDETKIPTEIYSSELKQTFEEFRFNDVLQTLWNVHLFAIDQRINQEKPWTIKDNFQLKTILQACINDLRNLALKLKPFLPQTAEKIEAQFKGPKITSQKPLFPRI